MLEGKSINVHSNTRLQLALRKWEPAGYIGDIGNFFNGLAKSPRVLPVPLNIEWVQFVLQNCEILHSVRGIPYERDGDARQKFLIKPLKETNLVVAKLFFELWLHESSK